jgi:hypothetical protein
MSSVFDEQFEQLAVPDLFEHFAEAVLHYASGSAVGVSVTAIVNRNGRQNKALGQEVETRSGLETIQEIIIDVQADVACDLKDRWQVDGIMFEVTQVGMLSNGIRSVICQAIYIESQHRQRGGVL